MSIQGPHGRTIRIGQVWQSNDPRRLHAVEVVGFEGWYVVGRSVTTHRKVRIKASAFFKVNDEHGWTLLKPTRWHRAPEVI